MDDVDWESGALQEEPQQVPCLVRGEVPRFGRLPPLRLTGTVP
ncbi:hypothetical protein [Streptomyces sp. H27-S2]|nr:hypothetical protein [Streptomyces sp. H27-S2]MCY0951451.1 hypothetical protein [Streptomyces sp. H27-S2]